MKGVYNWEDEMGSSSCFSAQSRQWLAFLDESLLEELTKPQPILLISPEQQQNQQQQDQQHSTSSAFRREAKPLSEKASRKRSREEQSGSACSKAVREKIRRDKLNDKFLELSTALEPGRPAKTDKSVILSEAACVVQQLREEAQQLKDSNEKLRDAVKDLKAEKNDLRDEKLRLKLEKERLDEQLKTFSVPFMSNPATAFQAAAALVTQNHQIQIPTKLETVSSTAAFPGIAMWQWMSPTDTAQDGFLRAPVA